MKLRVILSGVLLSFMSMTMAQSPGNSETNARAGWQQCEQLSTDSAARLACFDHWVQQQPPSSTTVTAPSDKPAPFVDCHGTTQSRLSRFWELEPGSDCGRFNIRGYRPISLSLIASDTVNMAPSSPTEGHTASELPFQKTEGRIQLSVRTKVGQGFLSQNAAQGQDSLWFAYSQQSYWQIFTPTLSRPFRNTDHEPELIYIVPTPVDFSSGWRLRYSGISLTHQSNGQSLPLSRSWNRIILMAGMEQGDRFTLNGRLWNRISDGDGVDDNPGIEDYVGRAEINGAWNINKDNTVILSLRHSLNQTANGSWRVEWLQTLGSDSRERNTSGLRLHIQLFGGYGDSLVDYNRWRNVLSIGLSLVDW